MPPTFPAIEAVQAIVFDYGNTLIPFGREELTALDDQVFETLQGLYGATDRAEFDALRHELRMAPYVGSPPYCKETDSAESVAAMVRTCYGREATPDECRLLLDAHGDAFVDLVRIDGESLATLRTLAKRYPLALLSNYPHAGAIRASLEKLEIAGLFKSVVISGELGYVKPHPVIFAKCLEELGVGAPYCLFVGDNWLADVQGAKAVGMRVAHMTRWAPPETMPRGAKDFLPDYRIDRLAELLTLVP